MVAVLSGLCQAGAAIAKGEAPVNKCPVRWRGLLEDHCGSWDLRGSETPSGLPM